MAEWQMAKQEVKVPCPDCGRVIGLRPAKPGLLRPSYHYPTQRSLERPNEGCPGTRRRFSVDSVADTQLMVLLPPGGNQCQRCLGPHAYDVSVPSHLWNEVVRAGAQPDYLCASCVLAVFAMAGRDFTAHLWGLGLRDGIKLTVVFDEAHKP